MDFFLYITDGTLPHEDIKILQEIIYMFFELFVFIFLYTVKPF